MIRYIYEANSPLCSVFSRVFVDNVVQKIGDVALGSIARGSVTLDVVYDLNGQPHAVDVHHGELMDCVIAFYRAYYQLLCQHVLLDARDAAALRAASLFISHIEQIRELMFGTTTSDPVATLAVSATGQLTGHVSLNGDDYDIDALVNAASELINLGTMMAFALADQFNTAELVGNRVVSKVTHYGLFGRWLRGNGLFFYPPQHDQAYSRVINPLRMLGYDVSKLEADNDWNPPDRDDYADDDDEVYNADFEGYAENFFRTLEDDFDDLQLPQHLRVGIIALGRTEKLDGIRPLATTMFIEEGNPYVTLIEDAACRNQIKSFLR